MDFHDRKTDYNNSLQIPMGQSLSDRQHNGQKNQNPTDNTMTKRKKNKQRSSNHYTYN
jgi:hypothetical protein